jgi:hypothetical protein
VRELKQSTAYDLMVWMADSADHLTGKTGLTLTVTASKAGAAFASISPTVTERGSGWYGLALTSSHTDTLGDFAYHITGTGADPADGLCQVVANLEADSLAAIEALNDFSVTDLYDFNLAAHVGDINSAATYFQRLNATVSSRMATYTQPAGFLAATFPTDPADQSLVIAATDALAAALTSAASDVTAVKAKTDQMVFTVANRLDATASVSLTEDDISDISEAVIAAIDVPSADEVADEVAGRLGTATVTLAAPVLDAGDRLVVYEGDDYVSGERTVPSWTSAAWPDLTDASVSFEAGGVEIACVLSGEGTDSQTASLDPLTAEDTAALAEDGSQGYRLVATLASGSVVTIVPRAPMTVRPAAG